MEETLPLQTSTSSSVATKTEIESTDTCTNDDDEEKMPMPIDTMKRLSTMLTEKKRLSTLAETKRLSGAEELWKISDNSALQEMLTVRNNDQELQPEVMDLVKQMLADLAASESKRKEAESKMEALRHEQDMLMDCNQSLLTQLDACREQTSESNRISERLNIENIRLATSNSALETEQDGKGQRTNSGIYSGIGGTIVDVLSCSTIGDGLSNVFSLSDRSGAITPVTALTADQLVSPKLQSFFGVQLEDEKIPHSTAKSVRHLKNNRSRRKTSMTPCDARTPAELSDARMQRFFGVELEGDVRQLGKRVPSLSVCSSNAYSNSNTPGSVRLRHVQHNKQRKGGTWTTTLKNSPNQEFGRAFDGSSFPDTSVLYRQMRSVSAKASDRKVKLKNRFPRSSHAVKRMNKNIHGSNRSAPQLQHGQTADTGLTPADTARHENTMVSPSMYDYDAGYDAGYEVDVEEDEIDANYAETKKPMRKKQSGTGRAADYEDLTLDHLTPQEMEEELQDQVGLLQSEPTRYLSPRASGCMLSPKPNSQKSNHGVGHARDSMKLRKNTRSNSRNSRKPRSWGL